MALHSPTARRTALALVVVASLAGAVAAGVPGAVAGTQSNDELSVLAANGSVDERIDDADDLRAMRANGTLTAPTRENTVVYGDTLVVEIRSASLNDSIASADGADATERFFAALNDSETNLTVRALVGPERRQYDIALERSETRVVRDGPNATTYAVVDTSGLVLTERGDDERYPSFPDEDDFEVTLERPDAPTLEDRFTFVGPAATVRSPSAGLRLSGWGPARIDEGASDVILTGYTNLLPGRTAEVEAVGPNGTVLATAAVTTTENGTADADPERSRSDFEALLGDVSAAEHDRFTLRMASGNRTVWERRVVVGPEPRWSNITATAVETGDDSWTLRVNASVLVPDRALFGVDLDSGDENYGRIAVAPEGRSEQTVAFEGLDGSPSGSVEIELLWDADGNGEYTLPPDDAFSTNADVPKSRSGQLTLRRRIDGAGESAITATATPTATPTASDATATETVDPSPSPTVERTTTAATGADAPTETASPTVATGVPEPTTAGGVSTTVGGSDASTEASDGTTAAANEGTTAADGTGFGVSAALLALAFAAAAVARRR
ncbi:MAG: hypothetical protein ABEJ26_09240 [Halosimplex sp.]